MSGTASEIAVATRKSALALAQTRLGVARLQAAFPETAFRVMKLTTTGDRRGAWSLERQGGKGLFTKELEEALLDGRADLAVHSAKDLPARMPEGLALAGFLPREAAHDVLVARAGVESPATIATGSPRRRAQVRRLFPEAAFQEIRGNVETRLEKTAKGEAEATVLAAAGLRRLGIEGWGGLDFRPLSLDKCVPAAGQAAVAIQCRAEDVGRYAPHLDEATRVAVAFERAFLEELGGGCQVAYAFHYDGERLFLYHRRCGLESRRLPAGYVAERGRDIARKLIEQLELSDGDG